jgi:hypothetical protein
MSSRAPPELVALCGSVARASTLGALARAAGPVSGYRIGKTGSIPFPMVYKELERLRRAGLVSKRDGGWVLADAEVRRLFARRFPARSLGRWSLTAERRRTEEEVTVACLRKRPTSTVGARIEADGRRSRILPTTDR